MKCSYACGSLDHAISRRSMLAGLLGGTAGVMGINQMVHPAVAQELHASHKHVLLFFLAGGSSQLETWDPKPGTDTGGPFRAIPTSVPGTHICELLPYTAQQMHRMVLVRSINTRENEHGKGAYFMETGRRDTPALRYPALGSVAAKLLAPKHATLPGYIHVRPGGSGFSKDDSAFLGPKFASVTLGDGKPPANVVRPDSLDESADRMRNMLRQRVNQRFTARRRTAETEAYSYSFEQAAQLMQRRDIFELGKASSKDAERYGAHDFGRHCLLARRLLENEITCVKVTHSNYDTHFENFNFHIEQLGEFDRPFASLIEDLADRGLLESTLVVVMAEFGRTPRINRGLGRDHWGTAWSVAMAGCGLQPGALIGKTNDNGTAVTDREVDAGHLFHTYFEALGVNSRRNFSIAGQSIPIANPAATAIEELLA
jgi:uncharacterized protein (DUF1501 family)